MKAQFEKFMSECPAVAILRGITNDEVISVCDTLYEAGIRILEIPLNSPDAIKSIVIASEHCKERMAVGAGTVLTVEDVNNVHKAGGTFIISPNTDVSVIAETKKLDMVSIPGFFTVTEGFTAVNAGADYLKLFPADPGPGYIKNIQAVLKAPIMAVGGVTLDNIPAFMKLCCGVGIGSALYKPGKAIGDIAADAEKIVSQLRK